MRQTHLPHVKRLRSKLLLTRHLSEMVVSIQVTNGNLGHRSLSRGQLNHGFMNPRLPTPLGVLPSGPPSHHVGHLLKGQAPSRAHITPAIWLGVVPISTRNETEFLVPFAWGGNLDAPPAKILNSRVSAPFSTRTVSVYGVPTPRVQNWLPVSSTIPEPTETIAWPDHHATSSAGANGALALLSAKPDTIVGVARYCTRVEPEPAKPTSLIVLVGDSSKDVPQLAQASNGLGHMPASGQHAANHRLAWALPEPLRPFLGSPYQTIRPVVGRPATAPGETGPWVLLWRPLSRPWRYR